LYAGLMVEHDGTPWIIDYNCRFGVPETQPVMARLEGDLGAVLAGAAAGAMPADALTWSSRVAVCVVVAAAGYPEAPRTGDPITGLPPAGEELVVFHAGTARRDGALVSAGGRVLGVTGLGADLEAARAVAYAAVDAIALDGKQVRRDVGRRGA
nr:phosphoribosylamine--glycine ligase [Kofleriaceae bacterium]